jgi:hypothetical protein
MECLIRIAMKADAAAISQVIIGTLRESNAQDYSAEIINQVELSFSPQAISREGHRETADEKHSIKRHC